jgi:hypothetical protein
MDYCNVFNAKALFLFHFSRNWADVNSHEGRFFKFNFVVSPFFSSLIIIQDIVYCSCFLCLIHKNVVHKFFAFFTITGILLLRRPVVKFQLASSCKLDGVGGSTQTAYGIPVAANTVI